MKKIFLLFLITTSLTVSAQDTIKKSKIYHNEFGIDATSFIKQFLNFNQTPSGSTYIPVYYLSYRRYFKHGNIRCALGGNFDNANVAPASPLDSNNYQRSGYSVDARIGWEFFNDLSKRWQVFYGLDFRPSYSYSKNDANYFNGGYANGTESKTQIYGAAPLLGVRFRVNDRISLITETSYSINFSSTASKRYYTPTSGSYPPLADFKNPQAKRVYSTILPPISLIFAFTL